VAPAVSRLLQIDRSGPDSRGLHGRKILRGQPDLSFDPGVVGSEALRICQRFPPPGAVSEVGAQIAGAGAPTGVM
jgi:hypothetical protein